MKGYGMKKGKKCAHGYRQVTQTFSDLGKPKKSKAKKKKSKRSSSAQGGTSISY